MSVIQKTNQIRYLKRKNLEEEARVIGNYYHDIIQQYGMDCVYYKLDTTEFGDYKNVIDENTVLKRAYGYELNPDYTLSADMVTYAEVDADIFNLNKFGITQNQEINFYFDSVQFACDMAPKLGKYKEYKIKETEIACEVPAPEDVSKASPYYLGEGFPEKYECEMLTGYFRYELTGYEPGKEYTVVCDPYEHTKFDVRFPVNGDLYYSMKYQIENDDYLDTLVYLTFTVSKMLMPDDKVKYLLHGKVRGSVLFFDLESLGKYSEKIHPAIGDIVEIDFPDDQNREKYEITNCMDKQLTQDGLNPLLHKYVWKCKARRYVNSEETTAPGRNEADRRLDEKLQFEEAVQEDVAKNVSMYDTIDDEQTLTEDAVYGGYDLDRRKIPSYDKQDIRNTIAEKYDFLDPGSAIDIMRFGCGSRLVTDGFDLVFADVDGNAYRIAQYGKDRPVDNTCFRCGLKWLKATNSQVVFVNIEGDSTVLAADKWANADGLEMNIESLFDQTDDQNGGKINRNYDNFIKFDGTRTVLFATERNLYAKLQADGRTYQLV